MIKNNNQKSVGIIAPKTIKFIKYNFNPINNSFINTKKREKLNLQTISPNNSKLYVYHKIIKNYIKTNDSFNNFSNLKVIEDNSSKLFFNKINNNETKSKILKKQINFFQIGENNNNLNRTIKEDRNSFNKSYKSSFIHLYKDRISNFNRRLLKKIKIMEIFLEMRILIVN